MIDIIILLGAIKCDTLEFSSMTSMGEVNYQNECEKITYDIIDFKSNLTKPYKIDL